MLLLPSFFLYFWHNATPAHSALFLALQHQHLSVFPALVGLIDDPSGAALGNLELDVAAPNMILAHLISVQTVPILSVYIPSQATGLEVTSVVCFTLTVCVEEWAREREMDLSRHDVATFSPSHDPLLCKLQPKQWCKQSEQLRKLEGKHSCPYNPTSKMLSGKTS